MEHRVELYHYDPVTVHFAIKRHAPPILESGDTHRSNPFHPSDHTQDCNLEPKLPPLRKTAPANARIFHPQTGLPALHREGFRIRTVYVASEEWRKG